jgi:alpha/beta superfamily hydrolase
MEKLKPVTFSSASSHPVRLEGILHVLDGEGQWPAAVICHPHPLGGGTMHNSVVTAIARALVARGVLALRFNFRGVGRSGGLHDSGRGEQADVAGAMDWLLAQPEVDPWRVSLVGYSFGAWVGLMHAQSDPRIAAAAVVGLVAWHYDAEFAQAHDPPISGDEDWPLDPNRSPAPNCSLPASTTPFPHCPHCAGLSSSFLLQKSFMLYPERITFFRVARQR